MTGGPGRELVAATGGAVVGAARLGRLLGRTSWRLARQLPGGPLVEAQVERVRDVVGHEARRLGDVQQQLFGPHPEEVRARLLVARTAGDPEPLRAAMSELLARSLDTDERNSRDYLFGTIMSQLVPDEARLLATLANRGALPAVDVVARTGRHAPTVVLANVSTLAAVARLRRRPQLATYLQRLHGLGLLEFGPEDRAADGDYAALSTDPQVRDAQASAARRRRTSVRVVRKTITLSPLGTEFWAASAPSHPAYRANPSALDASSG